MKRAPLGAAVAAGGAWLRDDRATVDAGQSNGMTVEKRYLTDICPVQRGRCHPGAWLTVDRSSPFCGAFPLCCDGEGAGECVQAPGSSARERAGSVRMPATNGSKDQKISSGGM